MADDDVNFSLQWFKDQSILAVYPDPTAFAAMLAKARRQADDDLQHVTSFEGYRQTLSHFFSTFNDAHAYVYMQLAPASYQWPGFLAVYQGRRFLVAGTDGTVANGLEVTECDGIPMSEWSERIAPYENIIPGLQSTRAATALLIFRDAGSPFLKRPTQCVIGGRTIDLQWKDISRMQLGKVRSKLQPELSADVSVTSFGSNGAWIRLGNFSPDSRQQSDQFEALYKSAAELREKSVLILDVRGNGGGPYGWFMGVLRSLYGNDYADYYARERLKISAVYRLADDVASSTSPQESGPDPSAPAAAPLDGTPFDADDSLADAAIARGDKVLHAPINAYKVPMPKRRPVNPVKARVFVLTDYECKSACIGFVDELKRFPGVIQVGVETGVDSRTGSPKDALLPSGNGGIGVPYMTRDNRPRNDNEPQKPAIEFDGNINDTAAVKSWLTQIVQEKRYQQ
ncbi:S41 family peptidase [Xanthomonas sp. NCPPB 1754]|uniref:S41 family peptidase n=1 Tax=Xanthomonas sp. NCPPB 1754 TaxID=487536 RepID=UPI003557B997